MKRWWVIGQNDMPIGVSFTEPEAEAAVNLLKERREDESGNTLHFWHREVVEMRPSLPREEVVKGIDTHGYIPALNDCPFKDECEVGTDNLCRRPQVMHSMFSCAIARGMAMVEDRK